MSNSDDNKVDSYDEGKGKRLLPDNNNDDTNSVNHNKAEMSNDTKLMLLRVGGTTALIGGIVLFILSAAFSAYIAIAAATLFVISAGCMFGSFKIDQTQSQEERRAYNDNIQNYNNKNISTEEEYNCGKDDKRIQNDTEINLDSQKKVENGLNTSGS